MVVASSPSWWLTELGVERSANFAMAASGTMVVAPVDRALPLDGSRAAVRLVAVVVVAPVEPVVVVVPLLPVAVETLVLPVAALAGTYTSFSASGDCAYWVATPMMTWYWFSSS